MKITFKTVLIIFIALALLRLAELQINAPNYMKAYLDMGQKSAALGQYSDAIKYYKKAIAKNPKSIKPYYHLALVYEQLNEQENKMKHFKKIVEIGANTDLLKQHFYDGQSWDLAHAYYEVGKNHVAQENLPMAIRNFELSLNHNIQFTKSYLELGLVYCQLNAKEKAFHYLNILKIDTNDHESIGVLNLAMRKMHPEWWE